MSDLLKGASDRVNELSQNLLRFTATEDVVHTEWTSSRGWSKQQRVRFDYVAEIEKLDFGGLHMSEMRDGGTSLQRFPGGLATLGLPAMVLVFNPTYSRDFEMKCEGRSDWHGRPAWVVYFQQRPERQSRLRAYLVKDSEWLLKLKGRAWLDAASFQVLHLETDLLQPIPQISLYRDHVAVDYEPVKFQHENEQLWLQKRADVYLDFRGHRYHRTHAFSGFLLFSVDVNSKDSPPAPQ